MTSNAGAVPWNTGVDDGEEGGDEESVGDTASIDMPELSEGQEMTHPKVPHLLSDLSDKTFSPRSRQMDLGRSRSLSSVGLGSINNIRVSQQCVSRSSLVRVRVAKEYHPPQHACSSTGVIRIEGLVSSVLPWWVRSRFSRSGHGLPDVVAGLALSSTLLSSYKSPGSTARC